MPSRSASRRASASSRDCWFVLGMSVKLLHAFEGCVHVRGEPARRDAPDAVAGFFDAAPFIEGGEMRGERRVGNTGRLREIGVAQAIGMIKERALDPVHVVQNGHVSSSDDGMHVGEASLRTQDVRRPYIASPYAARRGGPGPGGGQARAIASPTPSARKGAGDARTS